MNTRRFLYTIVLAILIGVALSSCSLNLNREVQGAAEAEEASILSNRLLSKAEDARDFCVRSVLAVIQANGGNRITAGTYRMETNGSGEYQPAPADRLLVINPDGIQIEMVIFDFNGNFAGNADQFLANPYQLKVAYQAPGWDNFMLIASRLENESSLEVSGWLRFKNIDFEVYLSRQTPKAGLDSVRAGESEQGETVQGVISSGERTIHVNQWTPLAIASDN